MENEVMQDNLKKILSLYPNSDVPTRAPVWKLFFPLMAAGLVARLVVGITTDVPLHFDEIMQYLEQAHRLVFNYGIVPWEYREGTRSLIVPGFISGILYGAKMAGVGSSLIYINVVKTVFCVLSMAIPAGMYFFARNTLSEKTAKTALVAGCFWYELIVFAHKPLTTFVATAVLMAALSLAVQKQNVLKVFWVSVLFILIIAIRLHLVPLVLVFMAAFLMRLSKQQKTLFVIGSILTILLVGYIDYLSWGAWWHSYYQAINFNLGKKVAAGFGTSPFYQYALWIALASGVLFYPAVGWSIYLLKKYHLLLIAIIVILLPHSIIGHKEYRFIFTVIPFWLLIASDMISLSPK
jgi:phosphatidylinositol glycan class B